MAWIWLKVFQRVDDACEPSPFWYRSRHDATKAALEEMEALLLCGHKDWSLLGAEALSAVEENDMFQTLNSALASGSRRPFFSIVRLRETGTGLCGAAARVGYHALRILALVAPRVEGWLIRWKSNTAPNRRPALAGFPI